MSGWKLSVDPHDSEGFLGATVLGGPRHLPARFLQKPGRVLRRSEKGPQCVQKREGVNTPSLPHGDGPGKTVLEAVSSARATWGTFFLPLQSPPASPFHLGREKKQANGS